MQWYHDKRLGLVKARDDHGNTQPGYICRGFASEHGDLISAAPDLLNACREVMELARRSRSGHSIDARQYPAAVEKAIAKAEGKTK